MEKKYQVFVSSTFTDLEEERKEVITSLLNGQYIPAGMELFTASDDEQFKYIKKIIDNCDYYVLIIAGRYGTINKETGMSYTEQEFEYAKEKGMPILAFLYTDISQLDSDKVDSDSRNINSFRTKVLNNKKLCKYWSTSGELIGGVINSLNAEISQNPRIGWTRGNDFQYDELLEQINHLRLKNETYEKRIHELEHQLEENSISIDNLASGDEKYEIEYVWRYNGYDYSEWQDLSLSLTWNEIFSLIGPYLHTECSYDEFKKYANKAICTKIEYAQYRIVSSDCIQTIKYQFKVKGLIKCYFENTQNGKQIEKIILSSEGRRYLDQVKSVKSVANNSNTINNKDDIKIITKKSLLRRFLRLKQ